MWAVQGEGSQTHTHTHTHTHTGKNTTGFPEPLEKRIADLQSPASDLRILISRQERSRVAEEQLEEGLIKSRIAQGLPWCPVGGQV